MVKRESTIYVCSNCGEEFIQWEGKCRSCSSWNSLKEFKIDSSFTSSQKQGKVKDPLTLDQIGVDQSFARITTGINEFDRVSGGGIVSGSVILLGGDPGIGKSTLLLQIVDALSKNSLDLTSQAIFYISGEESLHQLKIRATRIGAEHSPIRFLNETSLLNIQETILHFKPSTVIIDSIQTLYHPEFPSTPGSIVQVRECSLRLQQLAKAENITIILVGHINKDGMVAGPKTLEHLVDVVLYLEGEKYHNIRILRSVKNRFGDISESGLFEMGQQGMIEIKNPSEIFLSEKIEASGSVITALLEGRRPILIEIQALVKKTIFGYPQRTSSGMDINRLNLLLAVLEKRTGIDLSSFDVFINVVGGIKIKEPAADLAIILAIVSAKKEMQIDNKLVIWGEVGLAGEIRKVILEKERIRETERLGYTTPPSAKRIQDFFTSLGIK